MNSLHAQSRGASRVHAVTNDCTQSALQQMCPLQSSRPEFQNASSQARIKAPAGLDSSLEVEREIFLLPLPVSRGHYDSLNF